MANKVLNKTGVKNIMGQTWENYKGLHIMELRRNMFIFTFPNSSSAEVVLFKVSQYVMNDLISLQ